MKAATYFLSVLLMSSITLAGVDSSGGGGGGRLQVSNGYHSGSLDISVFSTQDGALATIRKFYSKTTAKQSDTAMGTNFVLDTNSAFIGEEKLLQPKDGQYYQLNLILKFESLVEIEVYLKGGMISFKGSLAEALYQSMGENGAAVIGQTLDDNGNVFGKSYKENSLFCEKTIEKHHGTWCGITL